MKFMNVKNIIISITVLLTAVSGQTTYNVSGVVELEDQTGSSADHSGVKVKFYNLPSMVAEDSTTSASTGAYSINISPGYYLVEWTKTGYVPWELGGLVLTANTVLEDVTMIPGSVQEVSGTINTTTWTTGYVYYVTDDITVPSGQTLTINAGVRVKFSSGKGMTVNGTLIANGTASSRIIFTSRESVPAPGDWDRIYMYGTNNQLSYFDYLYAANSLRSDGGDAVTNTTIDNGYFANLGSDAYGIYLNDGGGETISNNNITVSQSNWGIYINSNEDGSGVTVNSNTVTAGYGIYVSNTNCIISSNSLSTYSYGIQSYDNYGAYISNNTINGAIRNYAIKVNTETIPDTILNNHIERTEFGYDCCPDGYGIYQYDQPGGLIKGNTVIYNDSTTSNDYTNKMWGIYGNYGKIESNYIEIHTNSRNCDDVFGIYGYNSDIKNNTLKMTTGGSTCWGTFYVIRSENQDGDNQKLVQNNTINVRNSGNFYFHSVIRTDGGGDIDISNNTITADGQAIHNILELHNTNYDYHDNTAIVTGSYQEHVIELGGGSGTANIYSNTFSIPSSTSHYFLSSTNTGRILNFYNNTVDLQDRKGLEISNNSGSIHNNTMVSTNGDYGLYMTNSDMVVKNNNLVGFTASVYNENSTMNFNIAHNNTWNTSAPYTGTGLPPAIGSMIDVNANGITSDIYSNISQDPLFVYPDTNNYNLQASSTLIDAGDANYTDPDGSVADIGALYYHIYVTMAHTPLGPTNNTATAYTVNATVSSTSGAAVTANLSYSLDGGAATTLAMTAGTNNAFSADIPAQALNTRVQYFITGSDGIHTATLPRNTSGGGYEFYVNLFSNFSAISVASDIDGALTLAWSTPVPISGTLTEFKVYKNEDANVQLTSANLLVEDLDATASGYTDSDVLEGRTYYYKVVGVISDGSESLIGPEASGLSNASTIMRLRGVAVLADASFPPDHSGIQALFSAASPSAQSDSMVTDITGEIDIILNNGLYNIYFSKDGYQSQALGGVFMAANVVLDTVSIAPGGQTTISGDISGTLTGDTLYYASGDLTVPSGETLTIAAGAQLLFQGDYSLTANGTLLVNGTADNFVKFTSGNLVKSAGDWGGIFINKSGSRISYADIQYSSSAILASNIDSVTINYCSISNVPYGADGIRFYDGLKHIIIRNNTINLNGNNSYGIRKINNNDDNSCSGNSTYSVEIVGNTIYAYTGVYICGSYNARVDSNTILLENEGNTGIDNSNTCYGNSYKNNVIAPQDEFGWYSTGLNLQYNTNSVIQGNTVTNAREDGIYLRRARNDTISQNIITRNWSCGDNDGFYAIRLSEQSYNNYLSENTININNGPQGSDNGGYGYRRTYDFHGFLGASDNRSNTFVNNNITVGIPYDDNDARYNRGFSNLGDNAVLEGNKVVVYNYDNNWSENDDYNRGSQQSCVYGYYQVTSTNDTLIMSDNTMGIYASNLNMSGTVISNASPSQTEHYKAVYASANLDMDEVTITARYPVYFTGTSGTITNTTIVSIGDDGITATNASATLNIERLTLIGSGTATGLDMGDGVTLNMNSSVVDGFATGLSAVSTPNLYSNSFYNNSVHLSGNGIGAELGDASSFNVNGDPADIYGNIFLDPLFVDRAAGDYRPTINSPLVDAGAAAELDLDGTVADIGREFYNFGYAPMNLEATNIQSGTVSISWDIVETDSITGYQPYYKAAADDTWLYDPTAATTEKNTTYSGLTNNTLYDFAVTAEYNSGSTISSRSPVLQERPGVTTMTLSPKHLIVSQDVGGTATDDYTVSNPGSRDLAVTTDIDIGLGVTAFTKQLYADASQLINQDRITENVWITRQNTRGLINYAVETYHNHGYSPQGTEWAWGPTTSGQNYMIWRELRWNNDIGTSNHHTMYNNDYTVSLHLIEDDLYFNVTWHNWTQGNNGGGFSYTRTHVDQDGNPQNAGDPEFAIIGPGSSITRSKEFSGAAAGIYSSKIMVTSDDPVTPRDSIFTLNIVGPQASLPAVRFSPVDTTSEVFIYVVQEATIDGQALQTGDEIALFSGDLCVGAGIFNGVMPFLVRAYGADQTGFADGDPITVKAWDYGESRIASMIAVHTGGSSTFSSGGFSAAELTGTIYYTHDIAILSGSFNLLSTYLYPQFPAAGTFFGDIAGLMIVYEDNGAAYIPDYGINTIGDVDMVEGYHLYSAGGDQTLTVSGMTIDPANWSITLQPNQFNSMAFLHSGPMNAEAALAEIADVIDIVQDDAGNAWIPELSVLMGNMVPGKGYQVFTTVDTAVTFTYATYVAPTAKTLQPIEKPQPKFYTFRKTGLPYTIVLQAALVDDHALDDGDEVAVFDGNLCVGAMVWNSESANVLTAWKGNEDLELPGYIPGHDMTFQIYKKRFKENVFVDASFPDETEQSFEGTSYSRVALKGYPGLIPEEYALRQNYPNPFNPATTIRYEVADDAPVTMVIYNIIGQEVVRMLNNKVHAPGKYSIIWQGTNQYGKKVSAGVYMIHMYSTGFSETRKMILLK